MISQETRRSKSCVRVRVHAAGVVKYKAIAHTAATYGIMPRLRSLSAILVSVLSVEVTDGLEDDLNYLKPL